MGESEFQLVLSRDELDLFVSFAGCSLDEKPGSNWVQGAGGLPEYICQIARAVKRSGKTTSQAIAIAVSRVKKWASGVGVDGDTQAKAAKALAQWEKLKAKSNAKGAVKASHTDADVLYLANTTEYNMDAVRTAFQARQSEVRRAWRASNPGASYEDGPQSLYVREVWNTFLIAQSDYGRETQLHKISYTVDANGEVTFSDPVEVKTQYVVVASGNEPGAEITDAALQKMMDLTGPCPKRATDQLLTVLSGRQPTALEQVIQLSQRNRT